MIGPLNFSDPLNYSIFSCDNCHRNTRIAYIDQITITCRLRDYRTEYSNRNHSMFNDRGISSQTPY